MDERERALRSIEALRDLIERRRGFIDTEKAEQYLKDAEHYFKKGDYFTSFGASDYAYGLLEGMDDQIVVEVNGERKTLRVGESLTLKDIKISWKRGLRIQIEGKDED